MGEGGVILFGLLPLFPNELRLLVVLRGLSLLSQLLRVNRKEVPVQDQGNSEQETRVDALTFEDGIHIGTLAAELFRKPGDGAFLSAEFFFDEFSDVCHCVLSYKKKGGTIHDLSSI